MADILISCFPELTTAPLSLIADLRCFSKNKKRENNVGNSADKIVAA